MLKMDWWIKEAMQKIMKEQGKLVNSSTNCMINVTACLLC